MRLNLGSGDHYADGWVNVDSYPGVNPDVVADITDLPFLRSSASMVYCGHVLEHCDYDTQLLAALAEIRRVLTPEGRLCIVGPDLDRAVAQGDPVLIQIVRDGGHRWPGDEHRWPSTETATLAAVKQVFPEARPVPIGDLTGSGWPVVSYVDWQFAILQ